VRDTWAPYNTPDLLQQIKRLAWRCGFRKDEDIEWLLGVATEGGAQRMGEQGYGLAVGNQADFVVVPGAVPAQAVIDHPPRTYVVKRGKLVAANGEYLLG
jgi:cytosine deaminase